MTAWRYPDQDVGGVQQSRRAAKRIEDRKRRDRRELAKALQERVQLQSIPRRDDELLPRIDRAIKKPPDYSEGLCPILVVTTGTQPGAAIDRFTDRLPPRSGRLWNSSGTHVCH